MRKTKQERKKARKKEEEKQQREEEALSLIQKQTMLNAELHQYIIGFAYFTDK